MRWQRWLFVDRIDFISDLVPMGNGDQMIGVLTTLFILADGVTRNNISPEGAIGRGVLVTMLVLAWLAWLWRSGVRLDWPAAVVVGILAAYTIAESYQRCCGVGISTWLIYAGVMFAQARARRDWRPDFEVAGCILAAMVLAAGLTVGRPQGGMLNRNMIAGALVALAPAAWIDLSGWGGRARAALVAAALAATASRGAILAGAVAAVVIWRPWERLGRAWGWMAAPSYAAFVVGLWILRPGTVDQRLQCAGEVMAAWWANSRWFGLGPGFQIESHELGTLINSHSSYITPLAVAGLVGALVICVTVAALARRVTLARWQWGVLAAVAVHAIVEENVSWWPVGIVAALACVDNSHE